MSHGHWVSDLSTAADGGVAWRAAYRAWGADAPAGPSRVAQPLRFLGQYADAETGLHYNRHRYYSPGEGRFVSQDPIGLAGGVNFAAYAPNPLLWVDPLGLSCTFDTGANRWRDTDTGRFRGRPSDPSELLNGGKIDHADMTAWANKGGLSNNWQPDPVKFPSGGFRYQDADAAYTYKAWGHGANASAPAGSNSAAGPTVRITRTPVGGTGAEHLQSGGAWGPYGGNQNSVHIPLDNSPF